MSPVALSERVLLPRVLKYSILPPGQPTRLSLRAVMRMLAASFITLIFLVGGISYGHGAYHDVVASLEKKLEKKPNDAALHFKLAEAHIGHDEWRPCLKELELVDTLAPGVYPTGFLRGLAYHIGDKPKDAKKELDAFIAANPKHVNALATRGRVLMKLSKPDDAAVDLQKAVDLSAAKHPEMVVDLATCYAEVGKPNEASKAIDAALKKAGNDPSLLSCALEIETKAANWDSALRRIDGLQKTAPSPEPWMAERAKLLDRAGRTEDAKKAWGALKAHLLSLPSLKRGTPQNSQLLKEAQLALGESHTEPVTAPPAP